MVHRRHQDLEPHQLPSYYEILELPCGCRDRRGCLERSFRKENFNGRCPVCRDFRLFQDWDFDEWLHKLPRFAITSLPMTDQGCGICLQTYVRAIKSSKSQEASKPFYRYIYKERPIQLPCCHVFGHRCIKQWLSPKSEGGSQHNTCPMCRKVSAFFKHSSQILDWGHI